MPRITAEALRDRIEGIKASLWTIRPEDNAKITANPQGAIQSTLAVLAMLYGDASPQIKALQERIKPMGPREVDRSTYNYRIANELAPILDAAVADYESGITGSIRAQAKGEVLGDFIALAREALQSGAEKVAAVLAAAALEETLKQLGAENRVDVYNGDYRGVVQKLKDANVLTGAQPGVANGYSTFRDRAFHGQFDQIERGTTESALAFTEGIAGQLS